METNTMPLGAPEAVDHAASVFGLTAHNPARGGISAMWRSFLNALVKAIAMCDPVAYTYYLDSEREAARWAALRPHPEPDDTYIDEWAALSERLGLWQPNENAGAGVPQ